MNLAAANRAGPPDGLCNPAEAAAIMGMWKSSSAGDEIELRILRRGGVLVTEPRSGSPRGYAEQENTVLNDILFFASVLTFSAAAILGYWQLLRAETECLEEVVAASCEPELVAEPLPLAV